MMAKSTMANRKIGADREIGPGERASKARSRRVMMTGPSTPLSETTAEPFAAPLRHSGDDTGASDVDCGPDTRRPLCRFRPRGATQRRPDSVLMFRL